MKTSANGGQRILAALIDFVLYFVVCYIIVRIFDSVGNLPKTPDAYTEVINSGDFEKISEYASSTEYKEYMNALMPYAIGELFIYLGLFIGYFVILPIFWTKQTLGRFVLKIKVVMNDGDDSKVRPGTIILREIVGVLLIGLLNVCCCILLIINIILVCCGKSPIHDGVANTRMVSSEENFDDTLVRTTTTSESSQKDNSIEVVIDEDEEN